MKILGAPGLLAPSHARKKELREEGKRKKIVTMEMANVLNNGPTGPNATRNARENDSGEKRRKKIGVMKNQGNVIVRSLLHCTVGNLRRACTLYN